MKYLRLLFLDRLYSLIDVIACVAVFAWAPQVWIALALWSVWTLVFIVPRYTK